MAVPLSITTRRALGAPLAILCPLGKDVDCPDNQQRRTGLRGGQSTRGLGVSPEWQWRSVGGTKVCAWAHSSGGKDVRPPHVIWRDLTLQSRAKPAPRTRASENIPGRRCSPASSRHRPLVLDWTWLRQTWLGHELADPVERARPFIANARKYDDRRCRPQRRLRAWFRRLLRRKNKKPAHLAVSLSALPEQLRNASRADMATARVNSLLTLFV